MKLKPNIYYELTNGVELIFAGLPCTYIIYEAEVGGANEVVGEADDEETQVYKAEDPETEGN